MIFLNQQTTHAKHLTKKQINKETLRQYCELNRYKDLKDKEIQDILQAGEHKIRVLKIPKN